VFQHLGRASAPAEQAHGSYPNAPPLSPLHPGGGSYSPQPLATSSPPPPGAMAHSPAATYTVGAAPAYASSPPVHGTPVYSSTGYLNKESYEAPSAPSSK
jgi:hypothetical protein